MVDDVEVERKNCLNFEVFSKIAAYCGAVRVVVKLMIRMLIFSVGELDVIHGNIGEKIKQE